eukprot:scaffold189801_cov34-Prasinocladus_malaysianus.AAC.1
MAVASLGPVALAQARSSVSAVERSLDRNHKKLQEKCYSHSGCPRLLLRNPAVSMLGVYSRATLACVHHDSI